MKLSGVKEKLKTPEIKPVITKVGEINAEWELDLLEKRLAEYVGAEYCVLTSSGTAGLLNTLSAIGAGEGDSVMCTSFSFFATAEIITLAGATPMLVDINPNTFNVDPSCLEYVLKKCVRTKQPLPKALIAVDIFGLPCDFDLIEEICAKYGVTVIEDMSCAFGASYKGKRAGNFGRFSVASFFPARPLGGIGDGGGVFCHSYEDAKLLRRQSSADKKQKSFDFVQASVIGEKLGNYGEELARRQLVAVRYRDNLKDYVKMQQVGDDYINAYTQFVIATADYVQRERVIYELKSKQIPCSVMHCVQRVQRVNSNVNEWERVVLANTQHAAGRLLAVPMHAYLSVRVVDYISECIMETVEQGS